MADAKTFNFELVSPEKILVSEPAWQVTIPGEEGYFGVRAGHMSLIAALKAGVVEVTVSQGTSPEKIFIVGGFADVTPTSCTILAEQAENISDLNIAVLEQDIANINEELKISGDTPSKTALHRKLTVATLKLDAVKAA